jgi:hypothetical protein
MVFINTTHQHDTSVINTVINIFITSTVINPSHQHSYLPFFAWAIIVTNDFKKPSWSWSVHNVLADTAYRQHPAVRTRLHFVFLKLIKPKNLMVC